MREATGIHQYLPAEERLNIASHAFGFALSLAATALLVMRAIDIRGAHVVVSFAVFGASLVFLYAASTTYHSASRPALRARLRIIDHASIYVLIAGTYTPFALVSLQGPVGWSIFGATWGLALAGIIMKLFFTGRFQVTSTLMYVLMGWIIVFAIKPLMDNLPQTGLIWLFAGGLAYTFGAVLYGFKSLKFSHALFHLFVLVGSTCHFVSIFFFVVPIQQ
jgi:hemolysin III